MISWKIWSTLLLLVCFIGNVLFEFHGEITKEPKATSVKKSWGVVVMWILPNGTSSFYPNGPSVGN